MKDQLVQRIARVDFDQKKNLAREYLQLFLLRLMHEAGANEQLVFVGGTALRVLHELPRFSEDLDFCLQSSEKTDGSQLEPLALFQGLKRDLEKAGYALVVKAREKTAVHSAFFRFPGLPRELGWSHDPRLSLAIKVEIDCRPPSGAQIETTLVQQVFPIALRHHDLPSLFAGKLHALFTRDYTKGRDWFDLVWYLTAQRGIEPNLMLLKNALRQTGNDHIEPAYWRKELRARFQKLAWQDVVDDVSAFLQRPTDLAQLSQPLVAKLLV